MREIDCSARYLPELCKLLDLPVSPEDQCIVCVKDGTIVAGMVYNMFNVQTVAIHIYVGGTPSKEWWWAAFDYPFNQLKVHKLICQIHSSNKASIEIAKHMGVSLEGQIKDFFPDGDLMVYTMMKDQCRVLNDTRWQRAIKWAA